MRGWFIGLILPLCLVESSLGGARHFTYIYEAPTAAPGSIELENYATSLFDEGRFTGFAFRHELEFGITPRFQASLYLANWTYENGGSDGGARYQSTSVEAIYNLTNPVTDLVGLSLYQEIGGGRRAFESESKLIAQKNFGPIIVAYNVTVEAGFEGEKLREHEGELSQALGVSYEITPRISVGTELLHEIILPDWKTTDADNNFFLGPNVSYRSDKWFATATALLQTTNTEDEPDYQVRLIFGIDL